MATISNMTIEELKHLIDERIEERLTNMFGEFDIHDDEFLEGEPDNRSWEQVKRDVEKHRWTPPPGTPSVTELLREDRDS